MAPRKKPAVEAETKLPEHLDKRPEMTWHDQLITLLHLGAAFEHALMVQYLYAAYSLGGEQVPDPHRAMVKQWQESFLAVAREEMGHLLTVQNVLTYLGAGFSLDRDRFPWAIEWFDIEPLSLGSLACYVNAEMPETEAFPEREEIEALAKKHLKKDAKPVHPVAEIYREIMTLLKDAGRIPESALHPETYLSQASWDEWGRGYKPDPRPLDPEGNLVKVSRKVDRAAQFDSHVLVFQVATRTDALAAIEAISLQGEGTEVPDNDKPGGGEWSHFRRFIKIYREFKKTSDGSWSPAAPAATNPHTNPQLPDRDNYISNEQTRNWAILFNVRYRMLLTYLMHTYQLAPSTRPDVPNVRAMVMHRVFGEMYQLKTLSEKLFQMPLRDKDAKPGIPAGQRRTAGPPFEMPWNLRIPVNDVDCWCLHRDILSASRDACDAILKTQLTAHQKAYITTLGSLDAQAETWIDKILAGMNSTARYGA